MIRPFRMPIIRRRRMRKTIFPVDAAQIKGPQIDGEHGIGDDSPLFLPLLQGKEGDGEGERERERLEGE